MPNKCRHYNALDRLHNKGGCARGWNINAWIKRTNGGTTFGCFDKMPCSPHEGIKPLFDCPDADYETDEEVQERRQEMSEAMDKLISIKPQLDAIKKNMIENRLGSQKIACPWCDKADALTVMVALGINNHMRANCDTCGQGFIE